MTPPFTLREEQRFVLRAARRVALVAELAGHLRIYFPQAIDGLAECALDDRLRQSLACADRLGLSSRQDLYRLINLHAMLGWDFLDRQDTEWTARLLGDPAVGTPSQRLQQLQRRVLFQLHGAC